MSTILLCLCLDKEQIFKNIPSASSFSLLCGICQASAQCCFWVLSTWSLQDRPYSNTNCSAGNDGTAFGCSRVNQYYWQVGVFRHILCLLWNEGETIRLGTTSMLVPNHRTGKQWYILQFLRPFPVIAVSSLSVWLYGRGTIFQANLWPYVKIVAKNMIEEKVVLKHRDKIKIVVCSVSLAGWPLCKMLGFSKALQLLHLQVDVLSLQLHVMFLLGTTSNAGEM